MTRRVLINNYTINLYQEYTHIYIYIYIYIYIIEREGEYPTPVYHSVVSLDRGPDLYNIIYTCGISLLVPVQCYREQARWEVMSRLDCTNSEIPHI